MTTLAEVRLWGRTIGAVSLEDDSDDRAWAEHFFTEGAGNGVAGVSGTLWAAYNGVTELIDHRVRSLDGKNTITGDSQRLNTIWFGTGAHVKELAFKVAVDKLDEWRN